MERTLIAFISLGVACGGREMGKYGTFNVSLTDEEWAKVDEVINNHAPGFIRNTLEEKYPEIHEMICDAAIDLAYNIIAKDGAQTVTSYLSTDDRKEIMMKDINNGLFQPQSTDSDEQYNEWNLWQDSYLAKLSMTEQTEYLIDRYDLKPFTPEGYRVCYYLTREEIPGDYRE